MIKLLIPHAVASRMKNAVQQAGVQEIGGVLFGEHVSEGVFRICEISIQRHNGSWIRFVRLMNGGLSKMFFQFFRKNNYRYTKFNYLGEWHSHPTFSLVPSGQDYRTMQSIVSDPEVGANFAVLMIVKITNGNLQAGVTLFFNNGSCFDGDVCWEGEENGRRT